MTTHVFAFDVPLDKMVDGLDAPLFIRRLRCVGVVGIVATYCVGYTLRSIIRYLQALQLSMQSICSFPPGLHRSLIASVMLPQDRCSTLEHRLALFGGPLPPLRVVALLGHEVEVAFDDAATDPWRVRRPLGDPPQQRRRRRCAAIAALLGEPSRCFSIRRMG